MSSPLLKPADIAESPSSSGAAAWSKVGTPNGSPPAPATFASPTLIFPVDVLHELTTTQPENLKCFDCSSADAGWASVSNGVFICLACAGIHRSLGVGVSVVRSVYMDAWTELQVQMMVQGGNRQLKMFLESLDIHQPPIEILYTSKAATFYRAKLKRQVESVVAGNPVQITIAESLELSRHFRNDTSSTSSSSNSVGLRNRRAARLRYAVSFPAGSMGMTISKDADSLRPVVSKVIPGSVADVGGVRVGDFLDGVGDKFISDFDILMHMIPLMPRPLYLHFSRESVLGTGGSDTGSMEDLRDASSSSSSIHAHHSSSVLSPTAPSNPSLSSEMRRTRRHRGAPILSSAGARLMAITLLREDDWTGPDARGEAPNIDGDHPTPPMVQRHISAPSLAVSLDTSVLNLRNFQSMKLSPHKSRSVAHVSSSSTLGELDDKDYHSDPESLASTYPRRTSSADKHGDYTGTSRQNSRDLDCRSPPMPRRLRSCSSDDCKDIVEGESFVTSQSSTTPRGRKHSSWLSRLGEEDSRPVIDEVSKGRINSTDLSVDVDEEKNTYLSNPKLSNDPDTYAEQECTLVLKRGMSVRVHCEDSSWRVGVVRDQHKDGSFMILFQNNETESHVPADRIALNTHAFQEAIELSLGSQSPVAQEYFASRDRLVNLVGQTEKGRDTTFEVNFDCAPMGLTITKADDGRAYISAIKEGGKAASTAVRVGDFVIGINGMMIDSYEVLMKVFGAISYPVQMSMLRSRDGDAESRSRSRSDDLFYLHEVHYALEVFSQDVSRTNNSAARERDSPMTARRDMHLEDIATADTINNSTVSVSLDEIEEEYTVGYAASSNNLESSSYSILADLVADLDARTYHQPEPVVKQQSYDYGERNCRDVVFEKDGEIGITLKQTLKSFGNEIASSEVIRVRSGTQAAALGIVVGAIVLGINGEPYVSHFHTADMLKNAPRPIVVRFMFPKC